MRVNEDADGLEKLRTDELKYALPETENGLDGEVVPMPTLPLLRIVSAEGVEVA